MRNRVDKAEVGAWNARRCSRCKETKTVDNFYVNRKRGGYQAQCKACAARSSAERYKKKKKHHYEVGQKWRAKNRDSVNANARKRYHENPEKAQAHYRKWRKNNLAYDRFRRACYVARKREATPAWADGDEIQYIYNLAQEKGLVVDHIVPLTSKRVCGLHCADNLRCVSSRLNESKGNRYWPDMPT